MYIQCRHDKGKWFGNKDLQCQEMFATHLMFNGHNARAEHELKVHHERYNDKDELIETEPAA